MTVILKNVLGLWPGRGPGRFPASRLSAERQKGQAGQVHLPGYIFAPGPDSLLSGGGGQWGRGPQVKCLPAPPAPPLLQDAL